MTAFTDSETSIISSTTLGLAGSMLNTYESEPAISSIMSGAYGLMLGLVMGLEHPEEATIMLVEHMQVDSPDMMKDLKLVKGMAEILIKQIG